MKKSLVISAKMDMEDFNKSITSMQQKLRELYAPSDAIRMQQQTAGRLNSLGMGVGGPTSAAAEQSSLRYRRELNNSMKDEFKKQEEIVREILKRERGLESLRKQEKALVNDLDKQLEIRKKINEEETRYHNKKQEYSQRNAAINRAADIEQAFQSRKMSDYGAAGGDFSGMMDKFTAQSKSPSMALMNAVSRMSSILAAVGAAVGVGGELYGNYAQSPLRTAANLGAGVQSTAGQESQIIGGRRSAFEAAWNPERSRAAQMALEGNRGFRVQTGGALAGNMLGYASGGAAAGGMALGPLGAIGGGLLGAGYGAYKAFSDPAQRSLALSPFSQRYANEYGSINAEQLGGNYQKSLANLKNQNPGKNLASQYYEQNYMGNLQAQRSMGMSDQGFYGPGGFAAGGGQFTPEMMMQASQGILGAGGSSRSAGGNSFFANQLQRRDLTNAPQVLGTLSGGMGSSEATRQATVKILAEGMRLGLDDSKFAEENRRFTQMAAEIVTRSGATSAGAVSQVAGGFANFVGENTVAGMGAAKTAYQQYQQMTSETTGARGTMRAAGFLRNPILNKMSTIDKQALLQIPDNEITEDNPMIAGLARKHNVDPADVVSAMKGVNEGSQSRFGASDKIRDTLRKKGIDVGKVSQPEYMKSLSKEDQALVGSYLAFNTTEQGNLGIRENAARAGGYVGKPKQFGPAAGEEAVETGIAAGRGRGADVTITETAKDFGIVLQNFRDFKKEIMPSADAISNFTGKIREMMIVLSHANEKDIPDIIKAYTQQRATTQPQTGKKSQ